MFEACQQGHLNSETAAQSADVPGVKEKALKHRLKPHARTKISAVQIHQL
jgi:hypothetical protein